MTGDLIGLYNDLVNKTWTNMVNMVGVHTVLLRLGPAGPVGQGIAGNNPHLPHRTGR